MTWEHHAAVPGDDGASLVVIDGALPRVTGDHYLLPHVLDAFASLLGRPTVLRMGANVELGDDHVVRLLEFDVAAADERQPLERADARKLAPPPLHEALERWLAEQRGAPVPTLRPPWARPGWHTRAERWVGRPLRQYRLWPLSAVLESEGEYFKAVFSVFHHEPVVTERLAREHPGLVPDVVRIEEREGWMLMRELRGTPGYEHPPDAALAALDEIHVAWRSRHDELRALGAPDRTLGVLERSVEKLVAQTAPEHARHVPALRRACRELAARGEPETLVHGDFHGGNVLIRDGRATIFDWSDACIAHPAVDRFLIAPDREDDVAATVACLHQAASYRTIVANLEPSDRWLFAETPREMLERAVEHAR